MFCNVHWKDAEDEEDTDDHEEVDDDDEVRDDYDTTVSHGKITVKNRKPVRLGLRGL